MLLARNQKGPISLGDPHAAIKLKMLRPNVYNVEGHPGWKAAWVGVATTWVKLCVSLIFSIQVVDLQSWNCPVRFVVETKEERPRMRKGTIKGVCR